jgi:hypothetical protein
LHHLQSEILVKTIITDQRKATEPTAGQIDTRAPVEAPNATNLLLTGTCLLARNLPDGTLQLYYLGWNATTPKTGRRVNCASASNPAWHKGRCTSLNRRVGRRGLNGSATVSSTGSMTGPEIDSGSVVSSFTLLIGGLAVLRGRWAKISIRADAVPN